MPTIKQKKAVKKLVENGGNVTKAMRDVKYSEATVNNPSNLTKSKNFEQLMNKYMPEKVLTRVGKQGLKAMKPQVKVWNDKKKQYEYKYEPDHTIRHKYLETGLKLRGKLGNEQGGNTLNLQINFDSAFLSKKDDTTPETKTNS